LFGNLVGGKCRSLLETRNNFTYLITWGSLYFPTFSPDCFDERRELDMGLGVLEDKHLEHVPGTAPLAEVLSARNLDGLHDGISHLIW